MTHKRPITFLFLLITTLLLTTSSVFAHQPYFEDEEFTFQNPWPVPNARISTAVYATLSTNNDVDYYAFEASEGQSVLLSLTIPQIDGHDDFAPRMALIGSGVGADPLPNFVEQPANSSAQIFEPPAEARAFFEPFSATNYWDRQNATVTMPETGTYYVAVWHGAGEIGRYVFVIGQQEVRGGDPQFGQKLREYWTPVSAPEPTPLPPTTTPIPSTATPVPPTATPLPPTNTPVSPTATPLPTATSVLEATVDPDYSPEESLYFQVPICYAR